jgi:uridine kinase
MAIPVFTIAISGCSSAGKSTLAFLLGEIFGDVWVGKLFRLEDGF